MRHWMMAAVLGLGMTGWALAEETPQAAPGHGGASQQIEVGEREPHPVISENGSWAGAMVIVIGLLFFLPAAVIGPIVRANVPEEVPPAHSHDEPPGSSHHHGPEGIQTPDPGSQH